MSHSTRNALVIDNLPLVGYLVNDLCSRATHLSRDDLASAGSLALITAADSFDERLGVPFGAYARRRIIGAFSDEMRSNDWASRGTRRRIRETTATQETLAATLGRSPTTDELASALGVDKQTVLDSLADADRTVSSIDDVVADFLVSPTQSPEESIETEERGLFVRAAVKALPEKMRYLVEEIYFKERTVKELAAELGATHSAISQQRSEAIRLLKDGVTTHYPDDAEAAPAPLESRISQSRQAAYLARVAEYAQAAMMRPTQGFDVMSDIAT